MKTIERKEYIKNKIWNHIEKQRGILEINDFCSMFLIQIYKETIDNISEDVKQIIDNKERYFNKILQIDFDEIFDGYSKNDLNLYLDLYQELKLTYIRNENITGNSSLSKLIIDLLDVKENDIVADVGSGDGLLYKSIIDYKGLQNIIASGIEINLSNYENSKLLTDLLNIQNEIKVADLYINDISNFDKGFTFPSFGVKVNDIENTTTFKRGFCKKNSSSEIHFIDKLVQNMNVNSKAIALVSPKFLFSTHDELYRKYLLDSNKIEAIIKLPANLFSFTSLAFNIIVFSEKNSSIKLIEASNFIQKGNRIRNVEVDSLKILDLYFSKDVKTKDYDEILQSLDYNFMSLFKDEIHVKHGSKLMEVAEVKQGTQYTHANFKNSLSSENTGYRILAANDIIDGNVAWNKLQSISPDEKLLKHTIEKGDLIITSKGTTVKFVLVDLELDDNIIVTGGMFIVRTNKEKLIPTFLKMFIESNKGQVLIKNIQNGSIVSSINKAALQSLEISCPSLDKQKEFVMKYVEKYNDYINKKIELQKIENELKSYYDNIEIEL